MYERILSSCGPPFVGCLMGCANMPTSVEDLFWCFDRFMAFDRHMNLVLGDAEEFRKLPPKKGISDEEVISSHHCLPFNLLTDALTHSRLSQERLLWLQIHPTHTHSHTYIQHTHTQDVFAIIFPTVQKSAPLLKMFMAFDRHMNLVLGDAKKFRKLPPQKRHFGWLCDFRLPSLHVLNDT